MALDKDSNGYTFGFAIALVVVVGTSLSLISMGLKPLQEKNDEVKKKLDILSAMMDVNSDTLKIDRSNAAEEFDKYVDINDAIVLDINGNVKPGMKAFDVDIKKEYKDKKLKEADKSFPLFIAEQDGKTVYVIPVVGKGLWGPIWGNICLGEDMRTITGASFGHKGETPGLGAEISQKFFIDRWIGEEISNEMGEPVKFEIAKDGSGSTTQTKVDGITGGTITSKGVEEMVNRGMKVYIAYFKNMKKQ